MLRLYGSSQEFRSRLKSIGSNTNVGQNMKKRFGQKIHILNFINHVVVHGLCSLPVENNLIWPLRAIVCFKCMLACPWFQFVAAHQKKFYVLSYALLSVTGQNYPLPIKIHHSKNIQNIFLHLIEN